MSSRTTPDALERLRERIDGALVPFMGTPTSKELVGDMAKAIMDSYPLLEARIELAPDQPPDRIIVRITLRPAGEQ